MSATQRNVVGTCRVPCSTHGVCGLHFSAARLSVALGQTPPGCVPSGCGRNPVEDATAISSPDRCLSAKSVKLPLLLKCQ